MISVVIPCYNAESDVGNAIESVLRQTRDDYIREIIVVDDGSTDRSAEVIRELARQDERIQYLYQENAGPSVARNKGVEASSKEYVAFLDADDCWLERKIEIQAQFLQKHPRLGLVYTDAYRQELDGGRRRVHANHLDYRRKDNLERLFARGGPILTPTVVMKATCFCELGGFDPALPKGQDSDLWLRTAAEYPVHHLSEPLVLVKTRRGSVASNAEEKVKYLHQITDKLVERYPRLEGKRKKREAHLEYYLGNYLLQKGRRREAAEAFARSITSDPSYWKSYVQTLIAGLPLGERRTKEVLRLMRKAKNIAEGILSSNAS